MKKNLFSDISYVQLLELILEKDGPGIKNNDFGFATLVSILLN